MANERPIPAVSPSSPTAAPVVAPTATEAALAAAMQALAESNQKMTELMERQAVASEYALKNAPIRRKTMAEYLKEKPRKRLLHDTFQNGRPVNPKGLSQETLNKLDTIAPGTYAEGLLTVIRVKEGLNGLHTRIHIFYSNKHEDQKMAFYIKFPTFTAIVNTIINEMALLSIAPVLDAVADPVEDLELIAIAP